jgi:hypothetical protein
MPASRSPNRSAKSTTPARDAGKRPFWPIAIIGLAAVFAVIIAALPASIVTRFLPPSIRAEDFSGSLWHGSAGKITIDARDAGALEWRLQPASLLGMAVAVDVHWVKIGFVIDAAVTVDRRGVSARDLKGGGPIEDLRDLGVAPGWRGTATVNISDLQGDLGKPQAAVGVIQVSNLTSTQVADGAALGGYELRLAPGAVAADGSAVAQINDTGGPLDVQAVIHYSANERTATLSGSLRERPDAPPQLRSQIDRLVQLRGRDPQGRVPLDFEFKL